MIVAGLFGGAIEKGAAELAERVGKKLRNLKGFFTGAKQTREAIKDAASGRLFANPEKIGNFEVFGSTGKHGDVFQVDIIYIQNKSGRLGSFRGLARAYEKKAREAGAEVVRIKGSLIQNPIFGKSDDLKKAADLLGYKIEKVGGDVAQGKGYLVLTKELK